MTKASSILKFIGEKFGANPETLPTTNKTLVGGLTEVANKATQNTTNLSALTTRVDGIISPTGEAPNPDEILDARVGADGVTYNNLGTANRTQFSDVKSEITDLKEQTTTASYSLNRFNKNDSFQVLKNTAMDSSGNIYSLSDYYVIRIPLIEGATSYTLFRPNSAGTTWLCVPWRCAMYDANFNNLGILLNNVQSVATPSNPLTRYLYINAGTDTDVDTAMLMIDTAATMQYTAYVPYRETLTLKIPENQKGLHKTITENLFDLSTYVDGEYVTPADGSFPTNSDFARSDYMPVTAGLNYVGNYTNHVCWYNANKTFISGTNLVFSSVAPSNAKYAVIDFNKTNISADEIMFIQADSLPSQYVPREEPLYRIPSDLILGAWQSIWKNKNVLFYGDSITAQITGDAPIGWGKYIYDTFSLNSIHGKGVGGQTFVWNNNTFQADANGNYVNRGTTSDNCLGCFPSWQRISTMIPASICNSIDVVVIMGGTNDFDGVEEISGGTSIDYNEPLWSASNTTDSAWVSSNEYNGGDYDVNTFCGAVASTIMKMQKRCPNAIIVLASPLSRSDLTNHKPTVKNGKITQDMADTQRKIAQYLSVPFFDITAKCGVNAWNQSYYYEDAVHPNANGGKLLARTMISELIGLYPRF